MRNAVILFTGDRRREEAAKSLPPGSLARIQLATARAVSKLCDAELFATGDPLHGATQLDIEASSLDELVCSTTDFAFDNGFDRVVLLAGDVAGITSDLLREVATELDDAQPKAVIGRSSDGGFHLAAFNSKPRIDWSDIGWFSHTAADDLERLLAAEDFEIVNVAPLDDIDDRGDLERIARTTASLEVRSLLRSVMTEPSYASTPPFACAAGARSIAVPRSPPARAIL